MPASRLGHIEKRLEMLETGAPVQSKMSHKTESKRYPAKDVSDSGPPVKDSVNSKDKRSERDSAMGSRIEQDEPR